MPTCGIAEKGALAFHVHLVHILLERMLLIGGVEDSLLLLVEAQHFHDLKGTLRELLDELPLYIIYV